MPRKATGNNLRILAGLGFPSPIDIRGRSSIADLFNPGQRCGIYVLFFETGEHYAGQAVDVTRRFCQHRQTHEDVVGISFKPIPENSLNDVEREAIWTMEQNGFRLRNIALTSIPKGESDFDLIMSKADQERWLHNFDFIDDAGPRLTAPDLRGKYCKKYERLMKKPHASDVIQILRTYVRLGIPAIRRGELDFWSVSCLPGKNIYARINVNWQEVCAIFDIGDGLFLGLQIAKSPLDQYTWADRLKLRFQYPRYIRNGHIYSSGGSDQTRIELPVDYFEAFIQEPQILSAIRLFNLRLMKKGPNNNGRYHCLDLADNLV